MEFLCDIIVYAETMDLAQGYILALVVFVQSKLARKQLLKHLDGTVHGFIVFYKIIICCIACMTGILSKNTVAIDFKTFVCTCCKVLKTVVSVNGEFLCLLVIETYAMIS